MMATVRPVGSLGTTAVTNSLPGCSSRTMPVTPPPGPVRVTSNTRTDWPATTLDGSGAADMLKVQGATVLQPSSALMATLGSPKLAGFATGGFSVRSVVPDSSRLFGSGITPAVGSKRAVMMPVTGLPSSLVGVSTGTALGA